MYTPAISVFSAITWQELDALLTIASLLLAVRKCAGMQNRAAEDGGEQVRESWVLVNSGYRLRAVDSIIFGREVCVHGGPCHAFHCLRVHLL